MNTNSKPPYLSSLSFFTGPPQSDGIRPPIAQIYVKQCGSGRNAGKATYTPSRGTGILEAKLGNLLAFLNDDEQYPLGPVLKVATGHLQFETIHPFRDCNGCTGQVFNIHYLIPKGILDYPILSLSRYIMDHKADYYALLAGVSQRGDCKSWLLYMLRAVEATANLIYDKINDLVTAKDVVLQAIIADIQMDCPEQLVSSLFTQPLTKVKHLTDERLYVENTARKYLNQLVDMKILGKKAFAGHHYYSNLELHHILGKQAVRNLWAKFNPNLGQLHRLGALLSGLYNSRPSPGVRAV